MARLNLLCILTLCLPLVARAGGPLPVWLDVDTSTGVVQDGRVRDVDDGLAMIFAFHSPEIQVVGVSVCFGNASLDLAVPIAEDVVRRFGPAGIGVHAGAASSAELGKATDATRALTAALERQELTILALGPVTNVATVLRQRPDLAPKVREIVVCAARRPGFGFYIPGRPDVVLPDANFEKDVPAMQVLLDSGVPIVFAGYESSCDTWLSREDLSTLAERSEVGRWISETSQQWLARWERLRGDRGFNPFDVLCVAWITHRPMLQAIPVTAHVTSGPDDRAGTGLPATRPTKNYLMAEPGTGRAARHAYVTAAAPEFHAELLRRLTGPAASPGR